MQTIDNAENLAATLARVLPQPAPIGSITLPAGGGQVQLFTVPPGWKIEARDDEALLARPRRIKATATFSDADSFVAYVTTHAGQASPLVWCDFDPRTARLAFHAVLDEHWPGAPAWRAHRATFEPSLSTEWTTWLGADKKPQGQVGFANFIEDNEKDFRALEGMPTSLDMLKLATTFEYTSDKRLKSSVRLQDGGVRLEYINDADAATVERMTLFEKFAIGIPVFFGSTAAYPITARLRFRNKGNEVAFWYELLRTDLVHLTAARELIDAVRAGLGTVPLLLGTCA